MKEEEVTEHKNAGPAGRHGASLLPASFLAGSWHERRVEESELRVEQDNPLEVEVTDFAQTPRLAETEIPKRIAPVPRLALLQTSGSLAPPRAPLDERVPIRAAPEH